MSTVIVPPMNSGWPATTSETLPVKTRTASPESRFRWTKWMRPVRGQYQPRMCATFPMSPLMMRQLAAPGAPGPPCVVMTSVTTSRLVCSSHVVFARLAGRAAEAVPAARNVAAAAANAMVLTDFMVVFSFCPVSTRALGEPGHVRRRLMRIVRWSVGEDAGLD